MDWVSSLQRTTSRIANQARTDVQEVGGFLKEAFADTAETIKDAAHRASVSMEQGADAAINYLAGDDYESTNGLAPAAGVAGAAGAAAAGGAAWGQRSQQKGPVWKPPPVEPVPKVGDLKKGTKVYRKGALAQVVKIDYEADPPALVVRMLDGGNEVGTDAAYVSLDPEGSARCHKPGIRVVILELQGRKELNGCRGVMLQYKADVARWNVQMDAGEVVSVKPRNISVLLKGCAEVPPPSQPSSTSASSNGYVASEMVSSDFARDTTSYEATGAPTPSSSSSAAPQKSASVEHEHSEMSATAATQQAKPDGDPVPATTITNSATTAERSDAAADSPQSKRPVAKEAADSPVRATASETSSMPNAGDRADTSGTSPPAAHNATASGGIDAEESNQGTSANATADETFIVE